MEKLPILSQQIYKFQYDGDLDEIVEKIETLPLASNTYNLKSSLSFLFEMSMFADLKEWVLACIYEAKEDLDWHFDLRITQSWFNKAERGMWHHRHAHSNTLMSGIFYITPSGSSTWFSMPSIWPKAKHDNASETYLPFFGWGERPMHEVIHKNPSTPGTLILFPSCLDHSVDEHDGDKPRYSMSFNTFPVGAFGQQDNYSFLDLRP